MGSGTSQDSNPDENIMVLMRKPYKRKLYVSKLLVSKYSEKSVSRKVICHAQVKSIVTMGSVMHITDDSLNLPVTLEEMGVDCFDEMSELTDVDLRLSNVWRIGEMAFACCDRLSRLRLPTTLREIAYGSFHHSSLYDVQLEHTRLRVMGDGCFCGCISLKRVSLPATLETIGELAFCGTSLVELRLCHCEGLRVIGNSAFAQCSLEILALPSHYFSMSCWVFIVKWEECGTIDDRCCPLPRKVDLIGSAGIVPDDWGVLTEGEVRCFDFDVQMGGWTRLCNAGKSMMSEANSFGVGRTVPLRPPM
jgi:hypothetical protein